jgi:hypothetical protein
MSYPKKHPHTTQSQVGGGYASSQYATQQKSVVGSVVQKDERFTKRREQLQQLLTNKFRGKYLSGSASMEEENNVDRVIKAEVARFLENEQMTEANLIRLDQRLGEVLQTRNSSYAPGRGNSRGDSANTRIGSGVKVDLSNADDTPILEHRSKNLTHTHL